MGKIRARNTALPILITSPTTITAAESSKVAWIVDHTNKIKFVFNDRAIQPNYIMHCAEYITTLPNQLLIRTSCGTLVQAFESLLSRNNSSYINKNAAEAITEILDCLEQSELFNNLSSENQLVDKNNQTIANKNQIIEALQNSAFKAGNAAGRSGVGYITTIANALAVFSNLPYSEVATAALPLILEAYLSLKPALANRFSSDFDTEKIIAQINKLTKTWNIIADHKQTKSLPMQEISEYIKKDIDSIHSPHLFYLMKNWMKSCKRSAKEFLTEIIHPVEKFINIIFRSCIRNSDVIV